MYFAFRTNTDMMQYLICSGAAIRAVQRPCFSFYSGQHVLEFVLFIGSATHKQV
jgi:hypothetical protein